MSEKQVRCGYSAIEPRIVMIRGQKVILDSDLARIYAIPTFRLNEAVKRNRVRFPTDFIFQLTPQEVADLTSQFAMSSSPHGGRRTLPYAFTEHGAIMAAMVLNSSQAVQMSVLVIRAFVRMRDVLATTETMARRLAEIEKKLLTHDVALRELYQKIRPLLLPPPEKPRRKIGFGVGDRRSRYKRDVKGRRR